MESDKVQEIVSRLERTEGVTAQLANNVALLAAFVIWFSCMNIFSTFNGLLRNGIALSAAIATWLASKRDFEKRIRRGDPKS